MSDNSAVSNIRNYLINQGEDPSDKNVMEVLSDMDQVYDEITDSRRWYDIEFRVVEVDGMLIGYDGFHITGDMGMRDMGLEYDIGSVREVEEQEVIVTKYKDKK